jgi:hypothetical protein
MQRVGEPFEPVHEPRSGAGEPRGRVGDDDPLRAERLQLRAIGLGLLRTAFDVVAARRDDHDFRPGRGDLRPGALLGRLARQPEQVHATGVLDQLRHPVPADEHRVQPLEHRHTHGRRATDGDPDAVDARGDGVDEVHARVLGAGRLGERADIAEHLAERVRIEAHDRRLRLHPRGDRAHVVDRHRAHAAQRLRDDQIGPQATQAFLVELVDRAAFLGERADGGVDLRRRQPGRE